MLDTICGPFAAALGVPLAIGLVAILAILAIAGLRLRRQNARLTLALSNTPQGLCMWDPSARLLVCNERYVSMYGMSPQIVRPGRTLREILKHRTEIGLFSGDLDKYIADILQRVAEGRDQHADSHHPCRPGDCDFRTADAGRKLGRNPSGRHRAAFDRERARHPSPPRRSGAP